jgi:hypothetical protein
MIKNSLYNLIIIGLGLYLVYINIKPKLNLYLKSCPKCECPKQNCPKKNCPNCINPYNKAYSYNYSQLFDPLISPSKYLQYFPNYIRSIASRGYSQYGVIGNISSVDSNNNTIVKRLLGRPKYHGSSEWQYYALDKDNIKYTIDHNKELHKGDTIKVNEYSDNLDFNVHKFDDYEPDFLRYNPYI